MCFQQGKKSQQILHFYSIRKINSYWSWLSRYKNTKKREICQKIEAHIKDKLKYFSSKHFWLDLFLRFLTSDMIFMSLSGLNFDENGSQKMINNLLDWTSITSKMRNTSKQEFSTFCLAYLWVQVNLVIRGRYYFWPQTLSLQIKGLVLTRNLVFFTFVNSESVDK